MIRLPRDMSRDDVSQWLNGGIYLVRTRSITDPVPVVWLGMSAGQVVGTRLDNGEEVACGHTSCYAVWPMLGSFNTGHGFAIHLRRVVERQYRRTFHRRCVAISVPWGYRIMHDRPNQYVEAQQWSAACRLPWYGEFPESFDEAEQRLMDGALSVAVNRRLVIAGSPDLGKRLLYMRGKLVASVVGGVMHPCCTPEELPLLEKLTGGRYDVAN